MAITRRAAATAVIATSDECAAGGGAGSARTPATRLLALALALALLLPAGLLLAGPAGAVSSKCKAGQVRVLLEKKGRDVVLRTEGRGRALCIRPRAATLTAHPFASRADRRRMRRGLMGRAVRDRRAARLLRRKLKAPATATAAARRSDRYIDERKETEPGVFSWGEEVRTRADSDEVGEGRRVTVVMEMDASRLDKRAKAGKATIRTLETFGSSGFGRRCPDSTGRLPLEYSYEFAQAKSVIAGGKRTVYGFSFEATATGHGQVGDDALPASFSYRLEARSRYWAHVTRESDDELLERKPTREAHGTFEETDVAYKGDVRTEAVTGRWRLGRSNLAAGAAETLAGMAQGEGLSVRVAFRKLIKQAETDFFWDRKCVELAFLPESGGDYVRGGTEIIDVEARSKVDGRPATGGTIGNAGCGTDEITPKRADAPRARFTVRDPQQKWSDDDAPCISGVEAVTRAGRSDYGSYDWTRRPPDPAFPWRYEVLDASLEETTSASRFNGLCDDFGPTAGSKRFGGGFARGEESVIERRSDGALDGRLRARVSARWTDHMLKGCRSTDDGYVACQTKAPDSAPGGDGTWGVQATVRAPSETADTARLTWSVSSPSVGFFDAGGEECNVHIVGVVPYEAIQQDVPMDRLAATGPQSFEFSSSVHLDRDNLDKPAQIDHAWTLRLTVRRVDAQGRPL